MAAIPAQVLALLAGSDPAGSPDDGREDGFDLAFALLTVDADGYPHAALLSRHQLRPGRAAGELLAVVWGPTTRANLLARPKATLLAADYTAAHYLKLNVLRYLEQPLRLGLVLELEEYARDSAGVELRPLQFRMSAEIAAREGWDQDAAALELLERAP